VAGFSPDRTSVITRLVAPNGVTFEKIIGPVAAAGLDQQVAKAKGQGW